MNTRNEGHPAVIQRVSPEEFLVKAVGCSCIGIGFIHCGVITLGITFRTHQCTGELVEPAVFGVVNQPVQFGTRGGYGRKLGVQFSLTTVALRALPVVILGGLTSVPGAIIGGLIIGVGEKLSEVYLGPFVGGGIEIWFAYVLALVFLLFRPQGLFGEKIIDRV